MQRKQQARGHPGNAAAAKERTNPKKVKGIVDGVAPTVPHRWLGLARPERLSIRQVNEERLTMGGTIIEPNPAYLDFWRCQFAATWHSRKPLRPLRALPRA